MKRIPQAGQEEKQPSRPQRPRSRSGRARPSAGAEAAANPGPSSTERITTPSSTTAKHQAAPSCSGFAEPALPQPSRSRSTERRSLTPSYKTKESSSSSEITFQAVGSLATHRATDDTIHPPAALPASETSRRGTELQAVRVTSAGHASNDATRPFAPSTASDTSQPTISARDPSVALHRAPTDALLSASSTRNSESDIENMSAANIGPTPNYLECSSVDELLIMLDRDPGPGAASSPRTAYESDLIFLAQSFACSFASRGMLRAMARYAKTREEALRNSGALQSPLTDAEQRELAQVRNECRLPARTPATPVRRPFSAVDPGSEGSSGFPNGLKSMRQGQMDVIRGRPSMSETCATPYGSSPNCPRMGETASILLRLLFQFMF
ncbi:unnamed protein product [Pieris macdunnoughi]|uniref:Uncharacterized protein n=1 Tax=Pieris macdunnoughi TaxID=345717 RepID=A0A821UMP3_9NEOP|nr:unnamed protein product [Pieris macdunnoughi]